MGVRLCWRQRGSKSEEHFAAAQLLAKIDKGDWVGTLTRKMEREARDGKTHLLVVQRAGNALIHAAALPLDSVVPIWIAQRDASQRLINQGRLGRRKKNHTMNGTSPTLWLQEDNAPEIAEQLWQWVGVRDLAALPLSGSLLSANAQDDSLDDLPGFDYTALGSDGAQRVQRITSGVKRDARVREAVIERSEGMCERESCRAHRDYPGFLDVHHILGADAGDRVWNCVALCPNCHREVHAAPNRDQINGALLEFASQFDTTM
jgi:5-methylcytosine-specific restriction protein A